MDAMDSDVIEQMCVLFQEHKTAVQNASEIKHKISSDVRTLMKSLQARERHLHLVVDHLYDMQAEKIDHHVVELCNVGFHKDHIAETPNEEIAGVDKVKKIVESLPKMEIVYNSSLDDTASQLQQFGTIDMVQKEQKQKVGAKTKQDDNIEIISSDEFSIDWPSSESEKSSTDSEISYGRVPTNSKPRVADLQPKMRSTSEKSISLALHAEENSTEAKTKMTGEDKNPDDAKPSEKLKEMIKFLLSRESSNSSQNGDSGPQNVTCGVNKSVVNEESMVNEESINKSVVNAPNSNGDKLKEMLMAKRCFSNFKDKSVWLSHAKTDRCGRALTGSSSSKAKLEDKSMWLSPAKSYACSATQTGSGTSKPELGDKRVWLSRAKSDPRSATQTGSCTSKIKLEDKNVWLSPTKSDHCSASLIGSGISKPELGDKSMSLSPAKTDLHSGNPTTSGAVNLILGDRYMFPLLQGLKNIPKKKKNMRLSSAKRIPCDAISGGADAAKPDRLLKTKRCFSPSKLGNDINLFGNWE